jgi:hydroxymethylbilane synthase
VVCRNDDDETIDACSSLNDVVTALCTRIERDFLRALLGGCSTPISAFAKKVDGLIHFKGNILSLNGASKAEVEKKVHVDSSGNLGTICAQELLENGGLQIAESIRHAAK